ncbi:SH3 domain-containing protein [Pyxidicoccus xibeiensis]|uniref:hypothetical protein n=1 Tax=Pyxidicoccus xibeiensis TaxID=2906759 RepID=UPI0020A711E1|nr:hypothetical protein [Pyxidicoccus xibeiensis]MCP3137597.1 hypothetical protein [Pyxidicoccus xibeiensis]
MIKFPRFAPPPPPPAPAPAPAKAGPAQQQPAAAPPPFQFASTSQFVPSSPAGSSLHTEQLGDGRANCLEKAVGLARPGDSIVLMKDSRDGVGHALVRRPDGSVVDPNHPQVRYETLGQWQAMHPQYSQPVSIPAAQARQVLSTPPGPQREALIQQLGLSGVASRQVADGERWVTPTGAVTVRSTAAPDSAVTTYQKAGDRLLVLSESKDKSRLLVQMQDGTQGWISATDVNETVPPQPPRFPQWLAEGTRPPELERVMWDALGPDGQQQFIQAEREKAVAQDWPMPEFNVDGPPPPSIDPQTWNHLPPEDKQAIFREQWQAGVREQTALLFNDDPEAKARLDAGVVVTSPFLGVDSDVGRGRVGQWSRYIEPKSNAAQYFNLAKVFGKGWEVIHNNLCGPLAVAASLGLTPQQALTLFKNSNVPFSETSLKNESTTDGGELGKMFTAAGWTSETQAKHQLPEELMMFLEDGKQLIALVNIDTKGADGRLRDMSVSTKQVAHWVNVRAVEQDANGEWMVRVYNPFENREEVYSWSTFEASWSKTAGNTPYGMVVATPPAATTE